MAMTRPALSSSDLFLIAGALRHERANRLWVSKRRGHKPKSISQLRRLEDLFVRLAEAQGEPVVEEPPAE
jgi:hypothetical protein